MKKYHRFSEEERRFLFEFIPGHLSSETTLKFNEKFDCDLTVLQIQSFMRNNKIGNGRDTRFTKGLVSANKGKKGVHYSPKTQFKKGNIPATTRPIGSEFLTTNGYIKIKIAEPNVWAFKHKLVYEETYGKIPKGFALFFLNRDKTDCRLENLQLISRVALCRLNQNNLSYDNAELNESAVALAELMAKKFKIKNGDITDGKD